jgi:hypothetical protein
MTEALVPAYCSFSEMFVSCWRRMNKVAVSSGQQTRIFGLLSLFQNIIKGWWDHLVSCVSAYPQTPESQNSGVIRDGCLLGNDSVNTFQRTEYTRNNWKSVRRVVFCAIYIELNAQYMGKGKQAIRSSCAGEDQQRFTAAANQNTRALERK